MLLDRRRFLAKLGLGILAVPFIGNLLEHEPKTLPPLEIRNLDDGKLIAHYSAKEYALGFIVTRQMIEDDSPYNVDKEWLARYVNGYYAKRY